MLSIHLDISLSRKKKQKKRRAVHWENGAENRIRKENIVKQVKELGCLYCVENASCCLEFHHIDEKRYGIGKAVNHGHTLDQLFGELEKCELVCSNCHKKIEMGIYELTPFKGRRKKIKKEV